MWNTNLTKRDRTDQILLIGDKKSPVLVYRIKFPEQNVVGLCTTRSSEDSFSLLICFKKRLAMIQLQHDYTKNPKLYSLPKDMKLNPTPSKREKDASQQTHRGKLYLGLTQRSFISSEAGKDRCFERVERQQGGTIRRPTQKASMTYSRSCYGKKQNT